MFTITLPDNSTKEFSSPISGVQIAAAIGIGLAKAAIAIKLNGVLKDLSALIDDDTNVEIITAKSDLGLEILRHDAAHVLAEAVKELFPETQVTIGPVIENGFYYDFARETPFSDNDLQTIENRMQEIVERDEIISREVWEKNEAISFFKKQKEFYKAEIITELPDTEEISVYKQGNFIDLCRGPHLPSTAKLGKAFKLLKVAGSYWRGDANKEMLQRIYGTAWATQKELSHYLHQLEEAEKRDHRKLGRELDLFHFQEEAPGSVFWHPKGWVLFQSLIDYMRERQQRAGYEEIATPDILDKKLWEKSGHWEKFGENMFTTKTENENKVFALRPMNCPGGIEVFKQGITSYRDLPKRLAEFGKVHRFEPSGVIHGLLRVRSFTQDDAHIFCTEEQITDESKSVCDLILEIYREFGFNDIRIKFADRPQKRVGEDIVWDQAEKALEKAILASNLDYTLNKGEGAFYGPKLEFVLRDAIGRDWQLGTLQVDFNLPSRLGAYYIDEHNNKKAPVMLHRALFGSLERFTGMLIEHYAGKFPLWLSPVQVVVCPVMKESTPYAEEVYRELSKAGLRSELDLRNEKIGYKIRDLSSKKYPVIAVVGKREEESRGVAIRRLGHNDNVVMPLIELKKSLLEEITAKK